MNPVASTGKAVNDVGQVFVQGQTDGLILYALILGTFLMFVVAIVSVWMLTRALSRKDDTNAKQTADFIASADRTAVALSALAQSTAAGSAIQQNQIMTLARLEAMLARLENGK